MNADLSRPSPSGLSTGAVAPRPDGRDAAPGDKASARILVVDDDPDVRRVLGAALQLFNYQVDTAGDGAVGWAALSANSYDLVITDHMMPKLTGLDLIRRLRAVRQDLPCILISGNLPLLEAELDPLLRPGQAVDKPVKLEKLASMVRTLLAAHPVGKDASPSGDGRLTMCEA